MQIRLKNQISQRSVIRIRKLCVPCQIMPPPQCWRGKGLGLGNQAVTSRERNEGVYNLAGVQNSAQHQHLSNHLRYEERAPADALIHWSKSYYGL